MADNNTNTKIKISNMQQLLGALIEYATETKLDKAQFEGMAADRYKDDRDVRHSRVTDYVNEDLRGHGDNIVEMYRIANRVNNMAMDTNDIAYASFCAGVSAVGARLMGNAINISTIPKYITFLEYLKKDENYDISYKAIADLCDINNNKAGHAMETDKADIAHWPLDKLPAPSQSEIAQACMGAFFDKSIYGRDDNFTFTPAMKDFFNEAMAEGKKFMEAAYGGKGITPETPEQEAVLAHLKQLAKDNKKTRAFNDYQTQFENNIEEKAADMLRNPEDYVITNPTLKFDRVPLLLEGTTREGFISKINNRGLPLPVVEKKKEEKTEEQIDPNDKEAIARKKEEEAQRKKEEAERRKYRSYAETEYGESVVDNLMKQIYLDNELKDMAKHGIDPCAHIYVNGINALDLPCGETREVEDYGKDSPYNDGTKAVKVLTYREWLEEKGKFDTFDYAKLKCDICAAALSGSKIDVVKLHKENGEYVPAENATPIKVDDKDMDKEPISLWKRILMFFGIIKDPEKEITKSNQLESHSDTVNKIEESMRERMNFNDLTADEARPRTTEAVENDKQIEHTNEL